MTNLVQTLQTLAPSTDVAAMVAAATAWSARCVDARPLTERQILALGLAIEGSSWSALDSRENRLAPAVSRLVRALTALDGFPGADSRAMRQAVQKLLQAALDAAGEDQDRLAAAVQERLQADQAAEAAATVQADQAADQAPTVADAIDRLENATSGILPLAISERLQHDLEADLAVQALDLARHQVPGLDDVAGDVRDLALEIQRQAGLVAVPAVWNAQAVHELATILEAGRDGEDGVRDEGLLAHGYHWSRSQVPAQMLERRLAERLVEHAAYLADPSGLFWQEEEGGQDAGNLQANLDAQDADLAEHMAARRADLADLVALRLAQDLAQGADQAALDAAADGTWTVEAATWSPSNVLTSANYLVALAELAGRQHADEAGHQEARPQALQAAEKALQALVTEEDRDAVQARLETLTADLVMRARNDWSGTGLVLDLDEMAAWSLEYMKHQDRRIFTEDLADLAEEAAGLFAGLGEALDAEAYPVLDEDLMFKLEQIDEAAAWSDVDLERSLQAALEERWSEDLAEHLDDAWSALEGSWRQALAADLAIALDLNPVEAEHSNDGCWLRGTAEVLEGLATEPGLAVALETIETRLAWHDRLAQGDERGEPLEAADQLELQLAAIAIREALGRYLTDATSPALPFPTA